MDDRSGPIQYRYTSVGAGRSIAAYQAAISGGIAVGSWGWGRLTDAAGVEIALLVSAALMLLSPLLGLWLRMPRSSESGEDIEALADPDVRLALNERSGPLVVEIEYRVPQENARAFYNKMQHVQLSRKRNGAYGWSLARDIADPELWTKRYHCPTWLDYLRQRNRSTRPERELDQQAIAFDNGSEPVRIRRMLERPFGSVCCKDDAPDLNSNEVVAGECMRGCRKKSRRSACRCELGPDKTCFIDWPQSRDQPGDLLRHP